MAVNIWQKQIPIEHLINYQLHSQALQVRSFYLTQGVG